MSKKREESPLAFHTWEAPLLGLVTLAATERGLCYLAPTKQDETKSDVARAWLAWRYPHRPLHEDAAPFAEVIREMTEYLEGRRTEFTVALDPLGTPFQRSVWDAMVRIPHGSTSTYGTLAAELGRPTAARAVGAAVGANPLCVILPCHRLLGANGSLTGFAYGLTMKERLLALEAGVGK
jgi:O-6-methylguanine DNA methyltransferase